MDGKAADKSQTWLLTYLPEAWLVYFTGPNSHLCADDFQISTFGRDTSIKLQHDVLLQLPTQHLHWDHFQIQTKLPSQLWQSSATSSIFYTVNGLSVHPNTPTRKLGATDYFFTNPTSNQQPNPTCSAYLIFLICTPILHSYCL